MAVEREPKPGRLRVWFRRAYWACLVIALGPLLSMLAFGALAGSGPADCIVVPGAAVWRNRTPSDALEYRLDHAARLYREGRARAVVVTGGGEGNFNEASVMRDQLVARGVPPGAIVIEDRARNTRESGERVAEIMRSRGWRRAIVCTQWFHVARTRLCLEQAGIETQAAPCGGNRLRREPMFVLREMAALPAYALKLDLCR